MKIKASDFSFIILVGILIPLELACASLAYETIGEIASQLYYFGIIAANLLSIVLIFRNPKVARAGVITVALLVIPYQLYLGSRLLRVQAETVRIVGYVYEEKEKTGTFPSDLSDYTFEDTYTRPFIQDYRVDTTGENFTVYFRIGTDTTSHWYASDTGWGYYPD